MFTYNKTDLCLIFRSRSDEVNYAEENNVPILQNPTDHQNQAVQQGLDELCLPRMLDKKMNGVITYVRCPKKKIFSQTIFKII